MSDVQPEAQQPAPDQPAAPASRPAADQIDLEALTRAVERLWRRDLELERERLGPAGWRRGRPERER